MSMVASRYTYSSLYVLKLAVDVAVVVVVVVVVRCGLWVSSRHYVGVVGRRPCPKSCGGIEFVRTVTVGACYYRRCFMVLSWCTEEQVFEVIGISVS